MSGKSGRWQTFVLVGQAEAQQAHARMVVPHVLSRHDGEAATRNGGSQKAACYWAHGGESRVIEGGWGEVEKETTETREALWARKGTGALERTYTVMNVKQTGVDDCEGSERSAMHATALLGKLAREVSC